jgi:hypothetical protein
MKTLTKKSVHPALLAGLDSVEVLLMSHTLADVVRIMGRSETSTVPPPRPSVRP